MAHLFDFSLELPGLFLGLTFQNLDLVVGLVSFLVGAVRSFDDIGHLLALLVELFLQLLVKIIEDHSLSPKTVDDAFELSVDGDRFIKLLVGFVQPVFQYFDLFLEVVLVFCAAVHAHAIFPLLDDLLLKVGNVSVDIFLSLLLPLNRNRDLVEQVFHVFEGGTMCIILVPFVVDFRL